MHRPPHPPIPTDESGVPFDAHGIEPIPAGSRDCSPWELFWIWSGANIAPINWVLGRVGYHVGAQPRSRRCSSFSAATSSGVRYSAAFNVIGHRTAVNQMVLGRAPFGRYGSVVPGVMQFLLTMGWVGVNTWVVLDLVLAILKELGVGDAPWLDFVVAAAIMGIQLGLALYGFYAIRSFEKYTVPVTVLVMAGMTVLAMVTTDVDWSKSGTAVGAGDKFTAVTQLLTAIGIGWGLTWIPYASDYSRFVRVDRDAAGRSSGRRRWACTCQRYGWPHWEPASRAPEAAVTHRHWW